MSGDICVIVPTIREYECMRAYFDNARKYGFDLNRLHVLLVTEDFCDTEAMRSMTPIPSVTSPNTAYSGLPDRKSVV